MNQINKRKGIRLLTVIALLIMLTLPLSARERGDTVFSFRFPADKDAIYIPGSRNSGELAGLFECVEQYREVIKERKIPLHVDGYCNSKKSISENLSFAKSNSNRLKSELIRSKGLKESDFLTKNHVGAGDFVTIHLIIPGSAAESRIEQKVTFTPASPAPRTEDIADITYESSDISAPEEVAYSNVSPEEITYSTNVYTATYSPVASSIAEETENKCEDKGHSDFALKTNLLDYPILMPNLELEWIFARRWSFAFEGQIAWWAKNWPHKVYRLATIIPEVRYWAIERARWHGMYVGLFSGFGLYDLCNVKRGYEGEGGLVGVSCGYMWPVGKHLAFDVGLGVGYMGTIFKEYRPYDGHFLYVQTKRVNYFGPLRLKFSLTWIIPGCSKVSKENR